MTAPGWTDRVNPALRGTLKKVPNLTFGPMTVGLIRFAERWLRPKRPRALPDGVVFREERQGSQRLRIFQPEGGPRVPGALLWIHGGGRVMGTPNQSDHACARVAAALGVVVAATSYRLAPRHPYPAALDDCAAAYQWLLDHAEALGIDPARIVIGGESAGGGLAAELTQRRYDEGGPQPAGQALVYPMLDDRTAADQGLTAQKHLIWNNTSNRYGWSSYLSAPPGSVDVGEYAAAARREDLSGLPSAWLTVGTLDLFYSEDMAYIERLREAGVSVEVDIVEGGFHAYFSVGREEAPIQQTWRSLLTFLQDRFEDAAPGPA